MEKDIKKLLKIYELFDEIIGGVEKVGELTDWDRDQKVEAVYSELQNLQFEIFAMLRSMGVDPDGEDYED